MLKVVYSGIRKDGYDPSRGTSFEYNNFFLTLRNMKGVRVIEHPYDRILDIGKERYNAELYDLIVQEEPDLFFSFMYTDELDPKVLLRVRHTTKTKTLAWFADDYWRFWNYSRYWASNFSFVVTTSPQAAVWYREARITNVIQSQWACNTSFYKPINALRDIEVSFVGQYKPARARVIESLERAGIHVQVFGYGWPKGKISQEEMLRVFSRSKINLNLNVRPRLISPRVLARLFMRKSINKLVFDPHFADNAKAYAHFAVPHTHARPFELAGCGAFVISGRSDDIAKYYNEGKEMVFYDSVPELREKIRYYLGHDAEREAIARAGYERTMREHTYEKRLGRIFKEMGFSI